MKKLSGILFALCMALPLLSAAAMAAELKNGWRRFVLGDNNNIWLNIDANGGAELRKYGSNSKFYLDDKGKEGVTLKTQDGRYLGVSGELKNGARVMAVDSPYLWLFDSSERSLRPAADRGMIANASGGSFEEGTKIILWKHPNTTPRYARFRMIHTADPAVLASELSRVNIKRPSGTLTPSSDAAESKYGKLTPSSDDTNDKYGTLTPSPDDTKVKYSKIVDPYRPYSYEQMLIDCAALENMYPELVKTAEIGQSVEGRKIISLQLGRGARSIVMVGSHHAREYISSAFIMKMIDEYAYAYYTAGTFGNYDIRRLLDNVTIHAVVMLNPDGVNLVQNGPDTVLDRDALWRIPMVESTYAGWKANINGVDLNRQYPAEWNARHSPKLPQSQYFKGYSPATEPEVSALMSYTLQNDFLIAASLHAKGEFVYWADKRTEKRIPEQRQIAQTISDVTGYVLLPVSADPKLYAAGYENWFRAEIGRAAFCIELSPQNHTNIPHNDSDFDALVWNKAKYLGAALAEECLKLKPAEVEP